MKKRKILQLLFALTFSLSVGCTPQPLNSSVTDDKKTNVNASTTATAQVDTPVTLGFNIEEIIPPSDPKGTFNLDIFDAPNQTMWKCFNTDKLTTRSTTAPIKIVKDGQEYSPDVIKLNTELEKAETTGSLKFNTQEVSDELGISAQAKLKAGLFKEVGGKVDFAQKNTSFNNSVYVLLRSWCRFKATDGLPSGSFKIDQDAIARFRGDPKGFIDNYGDYFVSAVAAGGETSVLIRYTAEKTEDKSQLKTEVDGAYGKLLGPKVSGEASADVDTTKIKTKNDYSFDITRVGGDEPDDLKLTTLIDYVLHFSGNLQKTDPTTLKKKPGVAYKVTYTSFRSASNWQDDILTYYTDKNGKKVDVPDKDSKKVVINEDIKVPNLAYLNTLSNEWDKATDLDNRLAHIKKFPLSYPGIDQSVMENKQALLDTLFIQMNDKANDLKGMKESPKFSPSATDLANSLGGYLKYMNSGDGIVVNFTLSYGNTTKPVKKLLIGQDDTSTIPADSSNIKLLCKVVAAGEKTVSIALKDLKPENTLAYKITGPVWSNKLWKSTDGGNNWEQIGDKF